MPGLPLALNIVHLSGKSYSTTDSKVHSIKQVSENMIIVVADKEIPPDGNEERCPAFTNRNLRWISRRISIFIPMTSVIEAIRYEE